jgi:signal transduction histidine kinase
MPAVATLAAAGPLSVIVHGPGGVVLSAMTVLLPLTAYAIGAWTGLAVSAALLALILAGQEYGQGYVNPFYVALTGGPWLAAHLIRSRQLLAAQLKLRARELEDERELFAHESVRYERARIARELHDIVAHCVSVMVVQASAGRRLVDRDPSLAEEALDNIAEAAQQAQTEMTRLVDLLGDDPGDPKPVGLELVNELVTRARATGLSVTCRFIGTIGMPPLAAATAYRIVQEALTNALKHAPGAAVTIELVGDEDFLTVTVTNAAPIEGVAPLQRLGGGHGLRGMRERVAAHGGDVQAGPTADGGWRVSATLLAGKGVRAEASPAADSR